MFIGFCCDHNEKDDSNNNKTNTALIEKILNIPLRLVLQHNKCSGFRFGKQIPLQKGNKFPQNKKPPLCGGSYAASKLFCFFVRSLKVQKPASLVHRGQDLKQAFNWI
jgi:hypothetical protein